MGYCNSYRIYGGLGHIGIHSKGRIRASGKKKKVQRMIKAFKNDGWARKRAGRLAPQMRTSKHELRKELDNELY